MDKDISCKLDYAPFKHLCYFMLLNSIKSHPIHPNIPSNGSPVAIHTNERVRLLGLHSQSALPRAALSSGSSSQDSALICMHLCHIIQLVLQLTPTWHLIP